MEAMPRLSPGGTPSNHFLAQDLVARQARLRPERLALAEIATGRRLTFADLDQRIAEFEANPDEGEPWEVVRERNRKRRCRTD